MSINEELLKRIISEINLVNFVHDNPEREVESGIQVVETIASNIAKEYGYKKKDVVELMINMFVAGQVSSRYSDIEFNTILFIDGDKLTDQKGSFEPVKMASIVLGKESTPLFSSEGKTYDKVLKNRYGRIGVIRDENEIKKMEQENSQLKYQLQNIKSTIETLDPDSQFRSYSERLMGILEKKDNINKLLLSELGEVEEYLDSEGVEKTLDGKELSILERLKNLK
jgi:cupin superfamily acireductone dioxygenase involved in methionine salvage